MSDQEFGEYLKQVRKKAGLTLADLGAKTNLSHSYLSQIETGKKGPPSFEVLHTLAETLDIDYAALLGRAYNAVNEIPDLGLMPTVDILDLFEKYPLRYNGRAITERDMQRIRDMIRVLLED